MCFIQVLWRPQRNGGVAEWFKATVLKTVDCNRSMSSNPIASAIFSTSKALIIQGFVVSGFQEFYSSPSGWFAHLFGHFRTPCSSDKAAPPPKKKLVVSTSQLREAAVFNMQFSVKSRQSQNQAF